MVAIPLTISAGTGPEGPRFRHHSVEEGLSQSNVNCILQDHEGFIWLGTQDGLNRYDGYTFKVFRHDSQDSVSISDNYINSIFEDSRGHLFAAVWDGGVCELDPASGSWTSLRHNTSDPASLVDDRVYCLTLDRQGSLWIGTWAGLDRCDGAERRRDRSSNKRSDNIQG